MFNFSKIFGGETARKAENNEKEPRPVMVEGKEPFDPELRMFNFTNEEIAKFKEEGKSDQEIELSRKTVLNKLERTRFDN